MLPEFIALGGVSWVGRQARGAASNFSFAQEGGEGEAGWGADFLHVCVRGGGCSNANSGQRAWGGGTCMSQRRNLMLLSALAEACRHLIYVSRFPLTSSSGVQSLSLGHQEGRKSKPSIHWQGGEGLGGNWLKGRLIKSTNI